MLDGLPEVTAHGGIDVLFGPCMVAAVALLLAGVGIALWLMRLDVRDRRRRDRKTLRCPACGYDLRATPDRCPECGAVTTD